MELQVVQTFATTNSNGHEEIVLAAGDRFKIIVNPKVGDTVELLNVQAAAGTTLRIRVDVNTIEKPE